MLVTKIKSSDIVAHIKLRFDGVKDPRKRDMFLVVPSVPQPLPTTWSG